MPFSLGSVDFNFTGFMDITNETTNRDSGDTYAATLHTQPQLLVDVGKLWGAKGQFYAGVEYQFWKNKFGYEGQDQSLAQAMIQVKY